MKAHAGLNDSLLTSMVSVQVVTPEPQHSVPLAVAVYSLCSIPLVDTSAHDHLELGLSDRQLAMPGHDKKQSNKIMVTDRKMMKNAGQHAETVS